MIKSIQIQNYKALRDVNLDFTPIHVLIGPNDSGKTSILEAIAALCRSVSHSLPDAFTGTWAGRQLVWHGQRDLWVSITANIDADPSGFKYGISCFCTPEGRGMKVESEYAKFANDRQRFDIASQGDNSTRVCRVAFQGQNANDRLRDVCATIYESLNGVQSYRWDGRFLALPVAPDSKRRFAMEPSGFGLALILDDILGFDRNLFIRLENRFREIFPSIKSIKLIPEPAFRSPVDDPRLIPMLSESDGKGLYFEFVDGGEPVPARQVSDGLLLILAYLSILHLPEPPRVLLIEEPENGIHPKRLQEVLAILRDLVGEQSRTQVIMTTHSPYVVDLFQPDEVTLCKKESDGSVSTRRLSDSQKVRDQSSVFTLGEIWTAEGDNALVKPIAGSGASKE
jgi:predicted ATPase